MKDFIRKIKCFLFHKHENFEYLDTIHYPFVMKVKCFGCKKCDRWREVD